MIDERERYERAFERFPMPEPSWDRLLRRQDRKRRNQRITAGVVGFAVFAAAIWFVTTGGPFDRSQTPGASGGAATGPTATVRTVPPHPIGVGLLGLPPVGATPSTPELGEQVLSLVFGHTAGDAGRFSIHVYADGRVIWERIGDPPGGPNRGSTGLIEQRLTPEGVDLVLAEALSTGLFDHDRVFVGGEGLNYGGMMEVRAGDQVVQLAWGGASFEGGIESVATTPTPEQVSALERLDARLEDLTSWLPASAWEDPEFRPYVSSRYQVCYMFMEQGGSLGRLQVLGLLPARAEDLLLTADTTQSFPNGFRDSLPFWCSAVSTEEARELVGILEDAGAFMQYPANPSYSFSQVFIDFGPLLPHETPKA